MTDTNSEFLTIAEFSASMRVHKRTTLRMIARGAIRVHRLGRVVRIHRDEVERLTGATHAST